MARIFFQNTSLFRLKQARSATMRASKQALHVCNASLQQCGGSMHGCNGPLHVRINLMRRSTPQYMFTTTRCTNATAQCEFATTCCKNASGRCIAAVSLCIKTSLEKRLQRLIVTIHQCDLEFHLRQESRSQAEAAGSSDILLQLPELLPPFFICWTSAKYRCTASVSKSIKLGKDSSRWACVISLTHGIRDMPDYFLLCHC